MAYWDDITNAFEQFKQGFGAAMDATNPLPKSMSEPLNKDVQDLASWINESKFGKLVAQGAQAMQDTGADYGIPVGMLAKNFRSPTAIQELRKLMAEEMRSRGPITDVNISNPVLVKDMPPGSIAEAGKKMQAKLGTDKHYTPKELFADLDAWPHNMYEGPDPIDQILRGSWYHGMSKEARANVPVGKLYPDRNWYPETNFLDTATEYGFPISHHDTASISNKLGEPSGISLSMLPTKSQQFSADEFIHRVLPRYGGPPQERTVNLMTPEGRKALNDAYDVVGNRMLSDFNFGYQGDNYLIRYAKDLEDIASDKAAGYTINTRPIEYLQQQTGPFNQQLSQQLQSQGKRGILYNPQRWNEYEMLMLDPKYALPLDYRKAGEYMIPGMPRLAGFKSGMDPSTGRILEMTATPGVQKGLDNIRDLMSQNKSRLGDIYSERPWTQRLSDENKRRLLDLIDPQYREVVGNQLYE